MDRSGAVAIAGATGFVGRALAASLAGRRRVIGLARHPSERGAEGLEWRRCDLFSLLQVEEALEGVEQAVYLVHSMLPSAHLTQGVFQDFDLNWVFPTTESFTARAVTLFRALIGNLRNHPSIACWIAMNEAGGKKGPAATLRPGPQLVAAAHELDPTRPVIKNSEDHNDLESGDGHDYRGSLGGGRYTDIYGSTEKLVTEFGVDAPPAAGRLRGIPRALELLKDVLPRVAELHDYQYRLIKYYVEHYRIQKYAPNAGYFQFMWIDFCPQSFYGVYDYWGVPKTEGIGGGLKAFEESNQPVGIFMDYKDAPGPLWAVNDTLADLGECTASWLVTDESGAEVTRGSAPVRLGPDSRARVSDLKFPTRPEAAYRIVLDVRAPDGRELARNLYRDPFHHPHQPQGHAERMDHEIGMRLWWAPR